MSPPEHLFLANTPWIFWRLLDHQISIEDWHAATHRATRCLVDLPVSANETHLLDGRSAVILGEGQFGPDHWRLSRSKQLYYDFVRPFLPRWIRPILRRLLIPRQRNGFLLNWPIEDRYVRFQLKVVHELLKSKGIASVPYVHFWPEGKRFAFVLTHDVESSQGQQFVRRVASLEERYGFRSSINFVPEKYPVDHDLLKELQQRGFEVGVHGLRHDGRLFSSEAAFLKRAQRINQYLKTWEAVGFRSPLTHRHPAWMQALDVEYDSSFFDTDPYETIPGGTMSIWPFMMGQFVELPYTLPQDHTLVSTLGETTPGLWLEKVEFIERHCGLALVITHPDYLRSPKYSAIYEEFLQQMGERKYWHALPREVARWWRRRMHTIGTWNGNQWVLHSMPEATIGQIKLATNAHHIIDGGAPLVLVPEYSRREEGRTLEPSS